MLVKLTPCFSSKYHCFHMRACINVFACVCVCVCVCMCVRAYVYVRALIHRFGHVCVYVMYAQLSSEQGLMRRC